MSYGIEECYHLRGERGVTAKIKEAMQQAAKQFIYIGFLLWEVKQYEYFYEDGYDNVYQYAEYELGFKRSSTKNLIAICETFCRRDEHFKSLPTMFLDERWSDYQYSQLTEMLAMSPAQREQTKPSMTVKQLREAKKPKIVEAATIAEQTKETPHVTGQTSGYTVRWIPYNGRSPQKGKWPCKLVVHIVYLDGKPRENIDFGFFRNGKWENRQGEEIIDVKHYSEIPDLPGKYAPLANIASK